MVFGKYDAVYCSDGWTYLTPVSDEFWMFGGQEFYFYNFGRTINYRVMFSEASGTAISAKYIQKLNETGNLEQYREEKEKSFYYLHIATNKVYEWTIDNSRVSYNSSRIGLEYMQVSAIQPNPDNLEFVLGSDIFKSYCVAFDYEKQRIALAKCNHKFCMNNS
ncbi:unnamed protein product [Bursaphelenchus okinawaensis]|uniref:Peptidase A1 domain-containing protein n=1 Tax=Bursaphelenchus okinawaensis TaxID=465554 RepID=A0A811LL59_9BILA|nr:unnamed protein product [Bursaphelenchus okinawaensis]CAG9124429.1 unnamed protein product [Bursaphelenchus okinawaensis]